MSHAWPFFVFFATFSEDLCFLCILDVYSHEFNPAHLVINEVDDVNNQYHQELVKNKEVENVVDNPSDENEMWHLLNSCYEHKGPAAVRYPRGSGTGTVIEDKNSKAEIGKAKKIIDGKNLCILNSI